MRFVFVFVFCGLSFEFSLSDLLEVQFGVNEKVVGLREKDSSLAKNIYTKNISVQNRTELYSKFDCGREQCYIVFREWKAL